MREYFRAEVLSYYGPQNDGKRGDLVPAETGTTNTLYLDITVFFDIWNQAAFVEDFQHCQRYFTRC
jgi:hypothetical protein